MTVLSIFDFETNPVRLLMLDGQPHWVATDISTILGYRNAPDMVRMLDNDQKGTHSVRTLGGEQSLSIITESGMWTCVIRSKRPEAKRFVRWLTGEVLPALRRTGRYAMPEAAQLDDDEAPAAGMDLSRVTVALNLVREARKLFGVRSAQRIWLDAGLPAPCPSEAPALFADALAGEVRAFLATVAECTLDQLMAALGLPLADNALRLRCGRILRALGWFPWKVRRDGRPVNLFAPRTAHSVEA